MYLLVVAILVIAGCAKDDTMFETQDNLELKKAKVPIPFKAELYATPDMESEIMVVPLPWGENRYVPSKMIVSGTATHFGKINSEKSYYEFKTMEFYYDENDKLISYQTGLGILVGANGDSMEFNWWIKQSTETGDYFGENEIIPGSGTGKFEGCSGSASTVGGWHENGLGVWFIVHGFLVYE
jgi:hypothetical protein